MKLKDAIKKLKEMDLDISEHDIFWTLKENKQGDTKIEATTKRQTISINIKLEVYE